MKILKNNYIKCRGNTVENISDKIRIAFVRCPKCHGWFSLCKEDLDNEGKTRHPKRCSCGFIDMLYLEEFD
jgi:antirestriction protein